jgi:hypothetical protein
MRASRSPFGTACGSSASARGFARLRGVRPGAGLAQVRAAASVGEEIARVTRPGIVPSSPAGGAGHVAARGAGTS